MNTQLIPSPDILGLPAAPWPILVLMVVTLAAHWMFIGSAVGGTVIVLFHSLGGRRDETAATVSRTILLFLPFMLSMGVTLGIAPLLFVQVLYGNFFYTANVIIGGWWLLIVPLVIANLYLFYLLRHRLGSGRAPGAAIPAGIVAIFLLLALTLASNSALSQTPAAWSGVWAYRGAALHLSGVVLWRAAFALLGFLTVGGLFVALLAKGGWMHEERAADRAFRSGVGLSLAAGALQVLAGGGLLLSLGPDLQHGLFDSPVGAAGSIAATAFAALTIRLVARATKTRSWPALIGGISAYFAALVGVAAARDALRQAAIRPYFQLADVPVHPQWGPFAMFAVFLVVGILTIVVLVRLACSPRGAVMPIRGNR
jgi:hypothetical protein